MNSETRLGIATRLAYALLRQAGSLSLAEIEALPPVRSRQEALDVANRLLQSADGDVEESAAARMGPVTRQDQVVRLRSVAQHRRHGVLTRS